MAAMSEHGHLFYPGDLGSALRTEQQKLRQAAEVIPADHTLARSVEELAAELFEAHRPTFLAAMPRVRPRWGHGLGARGEWNGS